MVPSSASARTVLVLSCADTPVPVPTASTVTVKAVPWESVLSLTMSGSLSDSARAALMGAQTMPVLCRTRKAIVSGGHQLGGHDQIALVLTVGVIDDDDQTAGGQRRDGRLHGLGRRETVQTRAHRELSSDACVPNRRAW